jgi:hypothetical protein
MTLYVIGSFFPALAARDRVKKDNEKNLKCSYFSPPTKRLIR